MLQKPIVLVMLAALSANAAIIGHEVLSGTRHPRLASFASAVLSLDASGDLAAAESDTAHTDQHLLDALAKNPWLTESWIQLSARAEARGNLLFAKHYLEEAVAHDGGSAPLWASANFYFRQQNQAEFLLWANRYRAVTHKNEAGLFRMVAETSPSAEDLLAKMPSTTCDELGTMLEIVGARDFDPSPVVQRMSADCRDTDSTLTLNRFVSDLLVKDKIDTASRLRSSIGGPAELENADFATPISGEGFDWRINRSDDIEVRQPQKQGIIFEVDERLPSGTVLLFQPISLRSGATYRLVMDAHSDPPDEDAFRWELVELSTGRHLPSGLDHEDINRLPMWRFEAPRSERTLALALFYHRAEGSLPFQGTINVHGVRLTRELLPTPLLPAS